MLERSTSANSAVENVHQSFSFGFLHRGGRSRHTLQEIAADDALIQPYSRHAYRQWLEVYSRLAIEEAHKEYDQVIGRFPI
jgi:hypothetical protein